MPGLKTVAFERTCCQRIWVSWTLYYKNDNLNLKFPLNQAPEPLKLAPDLSQRVLSADDLWQPGGPHVLTFGRLLSLKSRKSK